MKLHLSTRLAASLAGGTAAVLGLTGVVPAVSSTYAHGHRPVTVEITTPSRHDDAGIAGAAWLVDLKLDYRGKDPLKSAGFTAPQLTGPAAHNNTAPFPGSFSTGPDERLPGLVVLTSTTNATLPGFSGPGTNLANLFNLTGVTDRSGRSAEIGDSWVVGAPIAGRDVDTVLTVAVVADLNHNGVYDDAPAVVVDANHDGKVDSRDLKALGVASNVETVRFHINGAAV